MKKNLYINRITKEQTYHATQALKWIRAGYDVSVTKKGAGSVKITLVHGQKPTATHDKNWRHCKRIAEDLDAYAEGRIYKCPECGFLFEMPEEVGDKFRCPECGEINETDYFEQLTLWDYFDEGTVLDIDYIVNYRKEYKACRILIAYGGPNIYIDTFTGNVELYWWSDRAKYMLLSETRDAIDEWAEEYYNYL